jgi:hypothetical protein
MSIPREAQARSDSIITTVSQITSDDEPKQQNGLFAMAIPAGWQRLALTRSLV